MRLQAADAGFPGADRLWTASLAECGNAHLMHIILRAGESRGPPLWAQPSSDHPRGSDVWIFWVRDALSGLGASEARRIAKGAIKYEANAHLLLGYP